MNRTKFSHLWIMAFGLALCACSSSSSNPENDIDASNGPDPFVVTQQAPLAVPPSFNLVPPRPGSPRPAAATGAASTDSIFGTAPKTTTPVSSGESNLIQSFGGNEPDLEKRLNRPISNTMSFTDKLKFWKKSNDDVLNADEEARRLKDPRMPQLTATPDKKDEEKSEDKKPDSDTAEKPSSDNIPASEPSKNDSENGLKAGGFFDH